MPMSYITGNHHKFKSCLPGDDPGKIGSSSVRRWTEVSHNLQRSDSVIGFQYVHRPAMHNVCLTFGE